MTSFNLEKLIDLYQSGLSSRQVAKEVGCSQNTVIRLLVENNIPRRASSSHRIHTFNYNYFDTIDTEDKAYFMGFLWADGFCDKETGNVVISLQEEDGYILDKFKNYIGYTGPIRWYSAINDKRKPICRLQFFNKHFASTLDEHGMVKAKSLIVKFPTTVPPELESHFIRGYFDGDGSAFISGNEYVISFCGTTDVLTNIKQRINCTYNINKGSICNRLQKDSPVKQLGFYGSNIASLVRDYLYKDATIYLYRKFKILENIPIKRRKLLKQINL